MNFGDTWNVPLIANSGEIQEDNGVLLPSSHGAGVNISRYLSKLNQMCGLERKERSFLRE
jgi:hypothetical protein